MTDYSPIVSVIITAYNCAQYVGDAIESVFAQTFKDIEIVVVDDGSTDDTRSTLARYRDRVRIFSQPNRGVSAARNVGVDLSKGRLIAFLDADDIFFPEKLKKQVAQFNQSSELGLSVTGWQVVAPSGEVVSKVRPWEYSPKLDLETAVICKPARPSSSLLKKEWFYKVNGFNPALSSAEDLDFLLRLMLCGCRAEWLPEIQIDYRQRSGSLMTQSRKLLDNTNQVMTTFFARPNVPKNILRLKQKERYHSLSWMSAKMYFEGDLSAMTDCLKQSLTFSRSKSKAARDWLRIYRSYAAEYGYSLDTYQLARTDGWRYAVSLSLQYSVVSSLGFESPARNDKQRRAANADISQHHEEKTHVLLYSDDPGAGGILQCNHAIVCYLAECGYRTSHVHYHQNTPLLKDEVSLGVQPVALEYNADSDIDRSLKDIEGAKGLFEQQNPSLIIFSDGWPFSNLAAKQAAIDLGIPYIIVLGFIEPSCVRYDPGDGFCYPDLATVQYLAASSVITVSQENLDLLRTLFGLPVEVGRVIYNGRPEKYFGPKDFLNKERLRQEANIPAEAVVCFTSGRLEDIKGYQHQIEAMKYLKDLSIWKDLYFVWAGAGGAHLSRSNETILRQAIEDLGVSEKVKFLGQRWDVEAWLDACDIFILPSHAEGMPLSVMEAMAKGLPVMASAVSGIPEELGDTGKLLNDPNLCAQTTVEELVRTIKDWSESAELRISVGERCRERAAKLFRQEMMVKEYRNTVLEVLAQKTRMLPVRTPSEQYSTRTNNINATRTVDRRFRYSSYLWQSWMSYIRGDYEMMDTFLEKALFLKPKSIGWPILEWSQYFLKLSRAQNIKFDSKNLSHSKVWQELTKEI